MGYLFSDEFELDLRRNFTKNPLLFLVFTLYPLLKKIYAYKTKKSIKNKIAKNPQKAVYLVPCYLLSKLFRAKSWDKFTMHFRLLCGKVDVPYLEISLTTRCTMRCESCGNLMQYFDKTNHRTSTLNGVLRTLDSIFAVADSIGLLNILGGEPLLFKDLDKVVQKINDEPKVLNFGIITNATIKPKEDLLKVLEKSHKFCFDISDYSCSPNLKIPLYQKEIIAELKRHKIPYNLKFEDKPETSWYDFGRIYKRNRTKEDIVKNFKACNPLCTSVMSGEFTSANNAAIGGGGGKFSSAPWQTRYLNSKAWMNLRAIS